MMVRVVRVASLPGGVSIFVDDQPVDPVIWVLEEDFTAKAAKLLEQAFSLASFYVLRRPPHFKATLRAV